MALLSITDVPAPAKLNLFLHITGRRADGYHLLQSVFMLIDWCDTLHFERRGDGRLARQDLGPPLPADDLCLRAARALQQASGTAFGAHISIDKRMPVGRRHGRRQLGCGHAAAGAQPAVGPAWPRERLAALALGLGADVPFFIGGQQRLGRGHRRADHARSSCRRARFAVVKPAVAIPTAAIFDSPLLAETARPVLQSRAFCKCQCVLSWVHCRVRSQRPADASDGAQLSRLARLWRCCRAASAAAG